MHLHLSRSASALSVLAFALLLSWPALRFALVPAALKRARVHEAAAREFLSRGLTRTRDKTGILIYVALAEQANGPIPRRVDPAYIWGDALAELEREAPRARIVNLETAVTTSSERAPKGINYRMNPANAACLAAARLDCCVLANNHVLDWGPAGLLETLDTLHALGSRTAGAGRAG